MTLPHRGLSNRVTFGKGLIISLVVAVGASGLWSTAVSAAGVADHVRNVSPAAGEKGSAARA
jgi:hypothetical protein